MYINKEEIIIDTKEVLRYMGCFNMSENNKEYIEIVNEVDDVLRKIIKIIQPKYVYKKLNIEQINFEGEDIKRYLCNEKEVTLIAVTLGHEYENECKKNAACGNIKKAVMVDAIGTELVEKCCDIVEEKLKKIAGRNQSSRFSPGYGDFDISFQKKLLDMLCADKIGIYYNEANMMFPQKTVTALVKFDKFNSGCKVCSKEDCNFKKY